MSDQELRKILADVVEDIDAGRVDVRSRRRRLGRWLAPPLMAAALGLGGCGDRSVGTTEDGAVGQDAAVDAAEVLDDASVDLYGVIIEDSSVQEDAVVDAGIDGDIPLPYAAPPILDFTRGELGLA